MITLRIIIHATNSFVIAGNYAAQRHIEVNIGPLYDQPCCRRQVSLVRPFRTWQGGIEQPHADPLNGGIVMEQAGRKVGHHSGFLFRRPG